MRRPKIYFSRSILAPKIADFACFGRLERQQLSDGTGDPFRRPEVAVADGIEDKFDAAGNTQFFENPKEIFLDGVLAELQLLPNFAMAQPVGQQRHNSLFARGKEFEKELRRHASGQVLLLDYVSGSDLEELLTHAMLFVLPSDLEGLSPRPPRRHRCWRMPATSDIPENRELVEGAGFTFQRGNVHDLERMLRFLISEPEMRQDAARRAAEKCMSARLCLVRSRRTNREVLPGVVGLEAGSPVFIGRRSRT